MPLDDINIDIPKKKAQHLIKILKLFSDIKLPFLLRYYVCSSPTFKYNQNKEKTNQSNSVVSLKYRENRNQLITTTTDLMIP
jgi:hypothetical protein